MRGEMLGTKSGTLWGCRDPQSKLNFPTYFVLPVCLRAMWPRVYLGGEFLFLFYGLVCFWQKFCLDVERGREFGF
jgi:hypothetical protein